MVFSNLTGMSDCWAGQMEAGWRIFAPKYANSAASSNESCGNRTSVVHDSRIVVVHPVDVGPNFNHFEAWIAAADQRSGIIAEPPLFRLSTSFLWFLQIYPWVTKILSRDA